MLAAAIRHSSWCSPPPDETRAAPPINGFLITAKDRAVELHEASFIPSARQSRSSPVFESIKLMCRELSRRTRCNKELGLNCTTPAGLTSVMTNDAKRGKQIKFETCYLRRPLFSVLFFLFFKYFFTPLTFFGRIASVGGSAPGGGCARFLLRLGTVATKITQLDDTHHGIKSGLASRSPGP